MEDTKENVIHDSKHTHGKSSYYHADVKLPEDVKKLLNQDVLLNDPSGPKLIVSAEEKPVTQKTFEITNYSFMNDGVWIKAIIDTEKYPALKDVTTEDLKCEFGVESFNFHVIDKKTNNKYALLMPRTRETIEPEKSKCYVRKNKIYIALHKEVKLINRRYLTVYRKSKIGGP